VSVIPETEESARRVMILNSGRELRKALQVCIDVALGCWGLPGMAMLSEIIRHYVRRASREKIL
jgi:hypothetical protein